MQPVDADEALILQLSENSHLSHSGGMNAAFADGSVQFLPADLPAEERRALITITGDDNGVIKIKD
jgi:prepilin-type processing-associated H-X9-DG protein